MPIETLRPSSREDWLAARGQTVGASEAAALLGVHPYTTAYELWALKTGQLATGAEESAPMRRGRMLERVAIDFLREERPEWEVRENAIPGGVVLRDTDVRLSATPDCFVTCPERGPGIVQIKSIEPSVFRRTWIDPDTRQVEAPLGYAVQTIVEAHLTGARWAALAPLVVGHGIDLPIVEVPIHEGVVERVREAVRDFWALIDAEGSPDPDYGRDADVVARVFREEHGTEIDLSADNHLPVLAEERRVLKADIKAKEARCAEIETEFKAKLGHHAFGLLSDGSRASWKLQHRAAYSTAAASFRVLRFHKS